MTFWGKGERFAHFAPFAQSPGNHEFDDHVEGLVPFVKAVPFPVVASNVDASEEPSLDGLMPKSTVVRLPDSRKVGIIGYITQDTKANIILMNFTLQAN